MYPSIERIHTKDGRRIAAPQPRLAKPASPPVAERFTQPFACALPLPAIPSTVPSRYEIRHDLKKTVQALLAFLDLGMVSETDLVEPCQSETEVLRRRSTGSSIRKEAESPFSPPGSLSRILWTKMKLQNRERTFSSAFTQLRWKACSSATGRPTLRKLAPA